LHLPGASNAYIPLSPLNKIKDYALNVEHRKGGPTAKWFREKLDIGRDDWEAVHDQIIDRLPSCWVCDYDLDSKWPYGTEWGVEIPIEGRNGRTCQVHTGWLISSGGYRLKPTLSTLRPCPSSGGATGPA